MSPLRADHGRALVVLIAFLLGLMLALGFGPQGLELIPDTDPGEPWGVHLSFTDDASTTMTFTWFTHAETEAASFVEHGATADTLGNRSSGGSQPVPGRASLRVHSATVTGLETGQEFSYRVGGGGSWSSVWTTRTAPEQGPYRILVFADQGVSPAARSALRDMGASDPDLILIPGDLAYAEDADLLWDEWFRMNEPLFATTPMMPAIGNHEKAGPHGAASYTARVSLPGDETHYSFTYGRTHVLCLDTTLPADHPDHAAMVEFARGDLEEAAARRTAGEIDHILVLQHHPLYSNIEKVDRQVRHDLVAWEEPLLDDHGVDLLLTGHNHHYERSYPLLDGNATTEEREQYRDPEGWIQVITGGAGRSLHDFRPLEEFRPITAAHERAHHYTLIDVDGPTLRAQATAAGIHVRQGTLDAFTLTNPGPDPGNEEP